MSHDVADLAAYRRKRDDESRAAIVIEHSCDPECANRSFYRLRSTRAESIQAEINYLTAQAESFGNGRATFIGPTRVGDAYIAIGEVIVRPDV